MQTCTLQCLHSLIKPFNNTLIWIFSLIKVNYTEKLIKNKALRHAILAYKVLCYSYVHMEPPNIKAMLHYTHISGKYL